MDKEFEKRQIALIDLDYFFAQCEQLRNPLIEDKPVVIIMPTIRGSGAVATCNYKARELKIRSGMSVSLARKLSNEETIFIDADKEFYKEISTKVFGIVDFSVNMEFISPNIVLTKSIKCFFASPLSSCDLL